jgi:two-component system response regulator WspF
VEEPYRPSVDAFFASLVKHWRDPGVAVLLTGMGRDGGKGMLALRRAGWHTIAQDEASCAVYGMPKAAVELGGAVEVLPPEAIARSMGQRIGVSI